MSGNVTLTRALLRGPLKVRFRPGLSEDAFWRLCQQNPQLDFERTAWGDLVIVAPAGADSDSRNTELTGQLWLWNRSNGDPGCVFGPSAGFTLPNTAVRGPDASWISRERWEMLPRGDRERFAHICPEFVVEIRSRSDRKRELRAKMREYLANGAQLGWLIDPTIKARTVEIYRPDLPLEVLKCPDTLSGEDILPGFVLDLKGILLD
ncbi:Uma2 family endonuclease [Tautonia rosea]|uniref:Uma2 family endonuclease n=1 Tax=Tautonia rosea TaxID=2728037 RepID=UPI00147485F4|nr:Uma2 family endonuclease [Tautonia rosea]